MWNVDDDLEMMMVTLTDDIKTPSDGDGGVGVELTDVPTGIRLLNISKLKVVSVSVVMLHRDAIILGNDVGVDRQRAFLRVQPGHLEAAEVFHDTTKTGLRAHPDGVVLHHGRVEVRHSLRRI